MAAAWRWAPLMSGERWHGEYGVAPGEAVEERQIRNLTALLEGYRPSPAQRSSLAAAIGEQMLQHAVDLEDMAGEDPAFAALVDRGFARQAREDAAWWEVCRASSRWRAALEPPA